MSGKIPVPFAVSAGCADLPMVEYTSRCASSMTLYAAGEVVLRPMEPMRVQCGIALAMPPEMMAIISCNPGQAELGVMTATETLGADDRGPVAVLLTWITTKSIMMQAPDGGTIEGDAGEVRKAFNHGVGGAGMGMLRAARLTIRRGEPVAQISFMALARVGLVRMEELRSAPGLPRDVVRADTEHSDWS